MEEDGIAILIVTAIATMTQRRLRRCRNEDCDDGCNDGCDDDVTTVVIYRDDVDCVDYLQG